MDRYHDDLTILAAELDATLGVFASLSPSDWTRSSWPAITTCSCS